MTGHEPCTTAIWKTEIAHPVLGVLGAFATDRGVCALLWDPEHDRRYRFDAATDAPSHPVLAQLRQELDAYFAGARRAFEVPLDPHGTAFQRQVWAALEAIPFGATRTYAQLAASVGRPRAARAVGAANGRNPISIVVPCHRVIGANGQLTGFAGGLRNKRWLLEHEAHSP
ncbi:MAG: methylated-DNA--[protein]-cysteine S-methyltransferase [Sandaracinaceae bacterium]